MNGGGQLVAQAQGALGSQGQVLNFHDGQGIEQGGEDNSSLKERPEPAFWKEKEDELHSKLGQPRYLSIMTITKSTPAAFGAAAALSCVLCRISPIPVRKFAGANVTVTTDAWGYELYWGD